MASGAAYPSSVLSIILALIAVLNREKRLVLATGSFSQTIQLFARAECEEIVPLMGLFGFGFDMSGPTVAR
ncbi:uncharacterized protein BDR25DRAFT_8672 [Lindgomyces ingoldianus]|uniref:Uncharacterized protein n=1 Tax=Lindgomyces ingoldianus TaxID=673940 RepID=A0ACB6RHH1_9PLEO|nr:uncharacterized protein BDR25DRAFT_8672 [Lindgomyces ingoldianus]KAF2478180.1 hypothetical protein BDR25DRAFT_8672 [Lindgomyces ingoldianus]